MKTPLNHGKHWTTEHDHQLERCAEGNTPTRVIALKLGRSEGSIYQRAADLGISLDPPNQSPYNRRTQ